MTTLSDLDYPLPEALIAREPSVPRDQCRLLKYEMASGKISDHIFNALPQLLRTGDLLVFNDSRVLHAKLLLRRKSGNFTTGLFVSEREPGRWTILLKSRGRCKVGHTLAIIAPNGQPAGELELISKATAPGQWTARCTPELPAADFLATCGHVPLPPYIEKARRKDGAVDQRPCDAADYQTIFAAPPGSLAAPTAGLHFTPELLAALHSSGINAARITLHVGLGTFLPITTSELAAHPMHQEAFTLDAGTLNRVRMQHEASRRIIAVGTTTVRALESAARPILASHSSSEAYAADTALLIMPGYRWQICDGLITNFHLPRSTLLALVAAKIGLEALHRCYNHAITQGYRFYSYGDAMLITE